MSRERSLLESERHARARWYVAICFVLAVCAYGFLGFDRWQTIGYAVSCFTMLNLVNFRTMFGRLPADTTPERRETNR